MPARLRSSFTAFSLCLSAIAVGCGGGQSSSTPPSKTLVSVAVTPATVPLSVGGTQQLTATATYSDGSTSNVSASASWSSSNSAAASVNADGMVKAVAAGDATINATLEGKSAKSSVVVKQVQPDLVSVTVNPSNFSVDVGAAEQLTATATYSDGSTANVTSSSTWSSSNAPVATVSSSGLVTGVSAGCANISALFNEQHGSSAATVSDSKPGLVSIAVTPASVALIVGGDQQLTATGTYSDGSQADISNSVDWETSNGVAANVNSSGLVTAVASGSSTISASLDNLNAKSAVSVGVNVPTWQNDNLRSGLNSGEGVLTPQNVSPQKFGKLYSYLVDGYVYGEPVFGSNLNVNGKTRNVVFVVTENDSVYAFDADNFGNGSPLWKMSLLQPGEAPLTNQSIQPVTGVTSTPVIDPGSQTLYVLSMQAQGSSGTFRLHALDLTTGAEKFGGPALVQAQVKGMNSDNINGIVYLTTSCLQRSALLLNRGSLFIGFGGCHSGWLLAYNAQTLVQTGVFNMSPNLDGEGQYGGAGGVWMGGGGPAADANGDVYLTTGNGPYDGMTAFGESVMKFDPQLHLLDTFTPYDFAYMDCEDSDLAAGGLLLIPGSMAALAGGKKGMMYLVNTSDLGGMQPNDAGALQTLWFESDLSSPYLRSCTDNSGTHSTDVNSYQIYGTGAFFNGSVYLGITPTSDTVPAPVRRFTFSGDQLTPAAYTSQNTQQGSYGTTPFISSAGTTNGIVWMVDHGQPVQSPFSNTPTSAVLRAYDATNMGSELYDSSENPADTAGLGIKFTSPIVANGKVFIGTAHDPLSQPNPQGELDIYGLKE